MQVHILLATYQGAAFLQQQLDSIARQSHTDWRLTISDDGSSDGTQAICERFAQAHSAHTIRLLDGPRRRSTANFFHLLASVTDDDPSEWFAFCDQDDVWLDDKLARAVAVLASALGEGRSAQPALYGARTRWVDEHLHPLGESPLPARPLGFGNALLQNVASGNTMVFNRPLLRLLQAYDPALAVVHDWTAYQLATGAGGLFHFDPTPALLYRQHAGNLIGAQSRIRDRFQRLGLLWQGQYRHWGELTERGLGALADRLTPQARHQLDAFRRVRHGSSARHRLAALREGHLWRQTLAGQLSLHLGAALGRL